MVGTVAPVVRAEVPASESQYIAGNATHKPNPSLRMRACLETVSTRVPHSGRLNMLLNLVSTYIVGI